MSVVVGLTGSIGMGKTTTADLFRREGVPVHDADAAVHALYRGEAAPLVEQAFPGTTAAGAVDRERLRARVVGRPDDLARLESIVHPLVRREEERFLAAHAGDPVVVLDVPLLFETGGDGRCHAVVVVTADPAIQAERVLARPGMTPALFAALLAKQMPDAEKRRRADYLVDTGGGVDRARESVRAILVDVAVRFGLARGEGEA